MNNKLPDSYYRADNALLTARVHKLEEENRELQLTISRLNTSIERYKNDMRELEEISHKRFRKMAELRGELKKARGEK